ncbi:mCG147381 [Mus musculus]|nr:mCG147381 [Mus musculus]
MLLRRIFGGGKVARVKMCCRLAPRSWRPPLDLLRCCTGKPAIAVGYPRASAPKRAMWTSFFHW